MSRGPRLILDGACYHVMIRGNQKQVTFIEEADFLKYFELVKYYKNKFKFRLYGYCLMPNHVHLILGVKRGADLSKIMQGLNLTYAMWFNNKYKKVGHLWQGRYKSRVIQKDKYMLDCIKYVELNPIRASLKESPFEYNWSSWKARYGHAEDNLLDTPEI